MHTDVRPLVERILRRLVMAGLPLLPVACGSTGSGSSVPHCQDLNFVAGFEPGPFMCGGTPLPLQTTAVDFDPADSRWAELYQACVASVGCVFCNGECADFCRAVAAASPAIPASGVVACQPNCNAPHQLLVTFPTAVCGRRPPGGIAGSPSVRPPTLGGWLAAAAELEAASVPAFRQVAVELEDFGAPGQLIDAARRAAVDEARHWRLTRRLAIQHGEAPRRPFVGMTTRRSIEDMAIENAAEGCVRETFGAALAAWQSVRAQDEDVRRLMADVATDEIEHAALAWRIDAWVTPRLDARAREARRSAIREALRELCTAIGTPTSETIQSDAGLPRPVEAASLLAATFSGVVQFGTGRERAPVTRP